MKKLSILSITIYQKTLSPVLELMFGKGCIYTPTCSQYAKQVIDKYGLSKGLKLSLTRLGSCQNTSIFNIKANKRSLYDPVK
jgi:putative membrane protein insertion efficiency factor